MFDLSKIDPRNFSLEKFKEHAPSLSLVCFSLLLALSHGSDLTTAEVKYNKNKDNYSRKKRHLVKKVLRESKTITQDLDKIVQKAKDENKFDFTEHYDSLKKSIINNPKESFIVYRVLSKTELAEYQLHKIVFLQAFNESKKEFIDDLINKLELGKNYYYHTKLNEFEVEKGDYLYLLRLVISNLDILSKISEDQSFRTIVQNFMNNDLYKYGDQGKYQRNTDLHNLFILFLAFRYSSFDESKQNILLRENPEFINRINERQYFLGKKEIENVVTEVIQNTGGIITPKVKEAPFSIFPDNFPDQQAPVLYSLSTEEKQYLEKVKDKYKLAKSKNDLLNLISEIDKTLSLTKDDGSILTEDDKRELAEDIVNTLRNITPKNYLDDKQVAEMLKFIIGYDSDILLDDRELLVKVLNDNSYELYKLLIVSNITSYRELHPVSPSFYALVALYRDNPKLNPFYDQIRLARIGSLAPFYDHNTEKFRNLMSLLSDPRIAKGSYREKEEISTNIDHQIYRDSLLYKENIQEDILMKIKLLYLLKNGSQKIVADLNALHNLPEQRRFRSIENYNANELLGLLAYGSSETYTSTFHYIFDRIVNKLSIENVDPNKFFLSLKEEKAFSDVLALVVEYGRTEEFLQLLNEETKEELFNEILNLAVEKDGNRFILASFMAQVKAIEDKNKLLSLLKKYTEEHPKINLFKLLQNSELLDKLLQKRKTTRVSELLNENNEHVQLMQFFNDQDGVSSFSNFIRTFKKEKFTFEYIDKQYVKVSKTNNGRTVIIYANIPYDSERLNENSNYSEEDSFEKLKAYLEESNIKIISVVQRGHSYHFNDFVSSNKIELSEAKLILVGACGGARQIGDLLQENPESIIIGTTRIGTMSFNDALNMEIVSSILEGGDNIDWENVKFIVFKNEEILNESGYILPNSEKFYYLILGLQ